jgi:hypothetical protein
MVALLFVSSAWALSVQGQALEAGLGIPASLVPLAFDGQEAFTDAEGRFDIEVGGGDSLLLFSSPNHQPLEVLAQQVIDDGGVVWLKPSVAAPEIVVEAQRSSEHAFRQSLDREQVERTPGTHDDPIRLLQSLPGVATTREYGPAAGAVIMRSAAPSDSRILIDGVEVPYLFHFQQYASVIHTRMLESVDVYPSAYGASYGDSIGGIVSVRTRTTESREVRGAANLNLIMGGVYGSAPFNDISVTVSGRRSYADLLGSGSDQYTEWPVFWDYLNRYDWSASADRKLALTLLGARDRYGRLATDTEVLDPYERGENPDFVYDRSYHILNLRYDGRGEARRLDSTVSLVGDWWSGTLPTAEEERQDTYLWMRHELVLLPLDFLDVSLGMDGRLGRVKRLCDAKRSWSVLAGEAPMLARGIPVDEALDELRTGIWVEPRFSIQDFSVHPGLRMQASLLEGDLAADPRLSMQWRRGDLGFRAAAGKYSKSPAVDDRSQVTGTPGLPMSHALHAAAGFDYAVASRWEFEANFWGRKVEDASRQFADRAPVAVDGEAYGVEVVSRYRMKERFFSWASLSLAHAEEGGVSPYDQPMAFDFVFSWRPVAQWDFGMRYRYASGMPYYAPASSIYDAVEDAYMPSYTESPLGRLPDYQKIDLHTARRWWFQRWSLVTYAELWWVPPSANFLYPIYNYDYSEDALVVGPGFVPLVGARVER